MSDTSAFDPFDILKKAMSAQYADLMPVGFSIYRLAEYNERDFPAPNLWMEKRHKPNAKYVAILISDTSSVPALGETFADAIGAAIVKIQEMNCEAAH